jgi:hypothetical protein
MAMISPSPTPSGAIVRSGSQIVVPRGADFSSCCFQCAAVPAGRPIVKHLPASRSDVFDRGGMMAVGGTAGLILLLIDFLLLILWFAWWIVDRPKARQRCVSFGLCLRHRRRRSMFRWLTLAGLPLGIALVLVGIFGNHAEPWDLLTFLAGCALIFGACMAMSLNPDPKLAGENDQFLWIANAGAPFLAHQSTRNI